MKYLKLFCICVLATLGTKVNAEFTPLTHFPGSFCSGFDFNWGTSINEIIQAEEKDATSMYCPSTRMCIVSGESSRDTRVISTELRFYIFSPSGTLRSAACRIQHKKKESKLHQRLKDDLTQKLANYSEVASRESNQWVLKNGRKIVIDTGKLGYSIYTTVGFYNVDEQMKSESQDHILKTDITPFQLRKYSHEKTKTKYGLDKDSMPKLTQKIIDETPIGSVPIANVSALDPFNIGEKIYITNFTYTKLAEFVDNRAGWKLACNEEATYCEVTQENGEKWQIDLHFKTVISLTQIKRFKEYLPAHRTYFPLFSRLKKQLGEPHRTNGRRNLQKAFTNGDMVFVESSFSEPTIKYMYKNKQIRENDIWTFPASSIEILFTEQDGEYVVRSVFYRSASLPEIILRNVRTTFSGGAHLGAYSRIHEMHPTDSERLNYEFREFLRNETVAKSLQDARRRN